MPGGWPGTQRHVNCEQEAETLKKEGNAFFGKGKYSAAIEVGLVPQGPKLAETPVRANKQLPMICSLVNIEPWQGVAHLQGRVAAPVMSACLAPTCCRETHLPSTKAVDWLLGR